MKRIALIKEKFPGVPREVRELPYTSRALLRAVVATYETFPSHHLTLAARANQNMRINALKSAVDMSGPSLVPTPEFSASGSTDKAHKSFYVGNALCAHAAYSELKVPWLVDVERLTPGYVTSPPTSNRRPDFLGQGIDGKWFVFETKGRSSRPSKPNLNDWKLQSTAIKSVNGTAVTYNIVSAAYISPARGEWELLWLDPSEEPEAADLQLEGFSFFEAYYAPIIALIQGDSEQPYSADDPLSFIDGLNAYIGLHRDVLTAFRKRDSLGIVSFAEAHPLFSRSGEDLLVSSGGAEVELFADGLIIRLGPDRAATEGAMIPQNSPRAQSETGMPPAKVGQSERATQDRVIALFRDELGYRYLATGQIAQATATLRKVC